MREERIGEGCGREFVRVLEKLRDRVITGMYPLGTFLPPQRALAAEFQVSRGTVQRALSALAADGWIASRQGSGSRVIKVQRKQPEAPPSPAPHPMALGPIIAKAFSRSAVSLDVITFTGESLDTHIRLQAERIRADSPGAPQCVAVRVLMPSDGVELPFPRSKNDPSDPRPVERLRALTHRSVSSLRHTLESLRIEGLVPEIDLRIHHTSVVPNFTCYLFNGSEALFGLYQVVERTILLGDEEELTAVDVQRGGASLMHYESDADPDSPGSVFVNSMQTYFDSMWNLLSE